MNYRPSTAKLHGRGQSASERRYDALRASGALSDPQQVHERVQAEAVLCPRCGLRVHPDNWQRHFEVNHPGEDIPEVATPDESLPQSLAKLDHARRMLAECERIDDVKEIRDQAEAMRMYAKQAKMGLDAQNHAAEIKIRAERRGGELLQEMSLRDKREQNLIQNSPKSHDETSEDSPPTLNDLGISKSQSSRWQSIATLPEAVFEQLIEETKQAEEELTSKLFQATAQKVRQEQRRQDAAQTPPPVGRYKCLVIDPPWPVEKIERDVRPNQTRALDYPTLTLDEIAALPVPDLADPEGCHLYLWVTQKYLPAGLDLLGQWGFRYQCVFTWNKPSGITPFSWMYNTELVLFGRRGNLPLLTNGLKLSFDAPTTGTHSGKPDVFYAERVIPASPEPRLEMFARKTRDGFTVWGNEVAG